MATPIDVKSLAYTPSSFSQQINTFITKPSKEKITSLSLICLSRYLIYIYSTDKNLYPLSRVFYRYRYPTRIATTNQA